MKQFVTREHEIEPVPGLPQNLPTTETMLWQGRPSAKLVARHVLKNRWIAGYFVILGAWSAISGYYDGHSLGGIIFSVAVLTALAAVLLGMLELFAWGVEKTTLYTITSERVVMRFGVALSMTLNLPYKQVSSVAVAKSAETTGNIAIALLPGHRMSWLVQWPHVRAWRISSPEPSLICLSDVGRAADILALAVTQYRNAHSGHARLVQMNEPAPAGLAAGIQAAE